MESTAVVILAFIALVSYKSEMISALGELTGSTTVEIAPM
jgi:hypothetical protein